MIIESTIGKFSVTAKESDDDTLIVTSENHDAIVSLLDSVELMGGAIGEDQSFSESDITPFTFFGKPHFRTYLSRAQLLRFFQYETLNFLNYTSLTQMRSISKGNYPS